MQPLSFSEKLTEAKAMSATFGVDVVFLSVIGSYAHGFATDESDVDVRGVYMPTMDDITGLAPIERNLRRESKAADVNLRAIMTFAHSLTRNDIQSYEMLASDGRHMIVDTPFSVDLRYNHPKFLNRGLARAMVNAAKEQANPKLNGMDRLVPGTKAMKRTRHAFRLIDMADILIDEGVIQVEHRDPASVYNSIEVFGGATRNIDRYIVARAEDSMERLESSDLPENPPVELIEKLVRAHYRQALLRSASSPANA